MNFLKKRDVKKCEFSEKRDVKNVNFVKKKLRFQKCEFCEKWDFRNVNFVKKRHFKNVNFCEKWEIENVNFLKNKTLKMWILWKTRLWKCEFCEKWYFEIVNFVKNETFKMWISTTVGTTLESLAKKLSLANSIQCSQAVTHPSTDWTRRCLTSEIGRELVYSAWYGRWLKNSV